MEPQAGLADAPDLAELLEHQGDPLSHPLVGILHHLARPVADVAGREHPHQLPAASFRLHALSWSVREFEGRSVGEWK